MSKSKEKVVISKFQSLLRSGMDFDVNSMCEEAGRDVHIAGVSARRIVNEYYKGLISREMISLERTFVRSKYLSKEDIKLFSEKFGMCDREGRLIIRYIRMKR